VAGRVALLPELVVLVVSCAIIGAIDDIITVRAAPSAACGRARSSGNRPDGRNLPARDRRRLRPIPSGYTLHAGMLWLTAPHWLWLLLGTLAITGTIHAVNLTDGLDGLATGAVIPPLIVFGLVSAQSSVPAAAIAASAAPAPARAF